MTLAQMITRIKRSNGNYSRLQILNALNEMVEIVYEQEMEQVTKYDSSTGMPPYIETTEGQYEYDCPADCRRTVAIFSKNSNNVYTSNTRQSPYQEYIYKGQSYTRIPVHSTDAGVDGTLAKVTFQDDPGTTTDEYYHVYTLKHTELTFESQSIPIPANSHWYLRIGTLAMLAAEDYGETAIHIATIEDVKKKIRKEMNKGAQARTNRTEWRPECRRADNFNTL